MSSPRLTNTYVSTYTMIPTFVLSLLVLQNRTAAFNNERVFPRIV